ncbi:MAG: hypothetical protein O9267_02985 [Flavobacterium sp.]|uniref:hypothetical protein n=1 Tax=Flavobacterium sp. TaxID=239 RepID=UPI0022CA78DD|nr:hypothetical protein [Flavobacterium sp.]MCZ8196558.1 hypothetical protein [Flavobacterium sp.]
MKKIVLLFLFLVSSLSSFSQNSYFVDKKGGRTIMDNQSVRVILIDKRISYSLPGKTWEKYVKFDDLDYAVVGSSLLRSFKLNNKRPHSVFFVFGEKEDKQLIGVKITTTVTSGRSSYSTDSYRLLVIDSNQMIIDDVNFNSSAKSSKKGDKEKVAPMVEKHFSDCPDVLAKLEIYRTSIEGFFTDTTYINCKK